MPSSARSLFQALFEEYHPMVMQLCKGYVSGDSNLAKDLLQETFINVWKSIGQFKEKSSYKTWIYRIAVNTCLQYHRKNKKQSSFRIEAILDQTPDEDRSDSEKSDNELYMAIDQLKKVDRVIIMMVLEELEYEEIAKVLGITESTLRVKIHRIKKRIKKIMTNG